VWTWGVRQLLKRVRAELDKVNPETLIFTEGCADIGREFGDGFIAHGHFWTDQTFSEPFVRFLHPQMREFESWGYVPRGADNDIIKRWFIWNCVNGHRVYAHNAHRESMAELSRSVRRYYDSFPEICDNPMSILDVKTENCLAQLFEGSPFVVTVGNTNANTVDAKITLPKTAATLLDRVDGSRIPVRNGVATFQLKPWDYKAFEALP
jgi:hypothetical protein